MKKITLALLAVFFSMNLAFSQTTFTIEAPHHTSNFIDLLPDGSSDNATLTAIYLVNQSELAGLTGTAVTGLGFQVSDGANGSVGGNISLYLLNTTDATYNAGTSFTAVTSTVTPNYQAAYPIPTSVGASTVNMNFANTFTYTGAGIYVCVKWVHTTGTLITNTLNLAGYSSNTTTAVMGAFEQVANNNTITDNLQQLTGRPCFLFNFNNMATNEKSVVSILAPGKAAKSAGTTQTISAVVRNNSVGTLTNIAVTLNITGANAFSNTQTITSVAAGSMATVVFAAYTPTAYGISHMSVTIPSDQNNTNNVAAWTQSVTCNVLANNPPDAASAFNTGVGFTPGNGGGFYSLFNVANASTLTAIRSVVYPDANAVNKMLVCVLTDDQGNYVASTDSVKITTAMLNTFVTFRFGAGNSPSLTPNTDYFIGMVQPPTSGAQYYPFAFEPSTTYSQNVNFFSGGVPDPTSGPIGFGVNKWGYLGIEPVLGPAIDVSATNTLICKGESINITADGGSLTYTWSATPNSTNTTISSPNAANINVTPLVTASYTVKGTDPAGCTNSVTLKITVNACNSIASNDNTAEIRLFPNPAVNGKCSVGGLEGTNTIMVYNMLGEVVMTKTAREAVSTIDLSAQPEGNYILRVQTSDNRTKTLKFVNQH